MGESGFTRQFKVKKPFPFLADCVCCLFFGYLIIDVGWFRLRPGKFQGNIKFLKSTGNISVRTPNTVNPILVPDMMVYKVDEDYSSMTRDYRVYPNLGWWMTVKLLWFLLWSKKS